MPDLYRKLTRKESRALSHAVMKQSEAINEELAAVGIRIEDVELPSAVMRDEYVQVKKRLDTRA